MLIFCKPELFIILNELLFYILLFILICFNLSFIHFIMCFVKIFLFNISNYFYFSFKFSASS